MTTKKTIDELMTRSPAFCVPESSLHDAARLMWEQDCGSLPVVRSENDRRVIGMITDRDVCMAAYHTGRALRELRVQESMSRDVLACRPDDEVVEASELMRRAQVRRLPVVDAEGRLEGLLSIAQLARAAGRGDGGTLTRQELGTTLAAISQPNRVARSEVPR